MEAGNYENDQSITNLDMIDKGNFVVAHFLLPTWCEIPCYMREL